MISKVFPSADILTIYGVKINLIKTELISGQFTLFSLPQILLDQTE